MKEKFKLFYIKNKIWIYPTKYILVACALAALTISIDTKYTYIHQYIPEMFLTTVDLAKTLLATLAGSLLSITTFTFSTTLVVLTMYSSQFSPRVLENFLSQNITLKVLGLFMGGFFYSILTLLFMRASLQTPVVVSASIGVLYSILCLIYFAVFINSVASSIQAGNLIVRLNRKASSVVNNSIEFNKRYNTIQTYDLGDSVFKKDIYSEKSGYLQMVDYEEILSLLANTESTLIIHPYKGDFIVSDQTIASLYSKSENIDSEILKKVDDYFVIQDNRISEFDYLYAIQKIVEVALRAISPGINDPNTAIECINILGTQFSKLAKINGKYTEVVCESKKSRIIYPLYDFKHDLYKTFYQIIIYGKDDISIVLSIYKALENAMIGASKQNSSAIVEFASYVEEKTEHLYINEIDKRYLIEAKKKIIDSCKYLQ